MTTLPIVKNREGHDVIPGPYIPSTGTCMWCHQPIVMDGEHYRSTTTGRGSCSPEDRGARCVWGFYALQGINPLTLSGHDGACSCQFSIQHVPASDSSKPYPYPNRIPYHHGQPARLTPDAWVCRETRCLWTIAPGPVGTVA